MDEENDKLVQKNKLALVVGVNNSSDTPIYRPALKCAEKDAEDIAYLIRQPQCGFTFSTSPLIGEKATSIAVKHALITLSKKRDTQDFLLFYFAGHAVPINDDIYLITYDFEDSDVEEDTSMHLSMRWLWNKLHQSSSAGCVLIILDCCYAGNIVDTREDPYIIDFRQLLDKWSGDFNTNVLHNMTRHILTATGYNIKAQELNDHGFMTELLISALQGKEDDALDKQGNVEIGSLYRYLRNKMPKEQKPDLASQFGPHHCVLAEYPHLSERLRVQSRENEIKKEVEKGIISELFRLHAETQHTQPFDHTICYSASLADLDEERTNDFLKRERTQQDDIFHPNIAAHDQLVLFGFLQKSFPTYGALLCFGQTPSKWVAGAITRCIDWSGSTTIDHMQDSREHKGSLLKQFEFSLDFLKKKLRLSRVISRQGREEQWEIPLAVIEEALANALIHREYVNRTDPVRVEVFNDRIEICSPGALPPPMTEELLRAKHKSYPRNPQIAGIFYLYGYIEKLGAGIQRMQRFMRDEGLKEPEFILGDDQTFTVVLHRPKYPSSSQIPPIEEFNLIAQHEISLSNPVVEVLHNRGDDNYPDWQVGSGFFVGPKLVLTALHNVVSPGELLVRVLGIGEYPAVVRLQGSENVADLALLEVSGVTVDVPLLRYGEVNRKVLAMVEECKAVGFPSFKERFAGSTSKRLTAQINRVIPTQENLGYQLLTLQVTQTPQGTPSLHGSEWQGMSGAVVFADNIVVGVISDHHFPEGEGSLSVVPVTAIDYLPNKDEWWQMLGINRSHLIILPSPEAELQKEGLHVWTEADLRRHHNLREQFISLSQVFDRWLSSEPQKRGQRLRVLWLEGEEGEHRHQALMACLSGVAGGQPPVYDAGMDLDLLAKALDQLLFSKSYAMSPLISVELSADEQGTTWTNVRNALAKAEKQFFEDDQPYPQLIVAGTGEQAQQAWQVLQERVEIKLIDTKGRNLERPYSFHGVHGMDSETVFGEDVFNRGLPITTKRLFGREDEMKTLTRAWNSERCRILSLVAYGGTGKSALVNTWLSKMRDQDYLGARKVFAWSFYSQGTKENLVSADVFVNQALTWLAPDEPIPLNPWAQGLTLARLIKRHRFLLVLDGLESLQYPLSAPDVGGQLTDDAIRALLEELSDPSDWNGLCVITTRVPLTDLHRFEDGNQKEMGRVIQLELENLDYQAGAALLRSLIRTDARQRDLEKAVEEVKGHALAITLLGNYLRDVHNGDLEGRFDLEKLTIAEREGGHARRIMASYDRWLQANQRVAELALLYLIGLFNQPASPEAMSALLAEMDRNRFPAELDRVGSDSWNRCVDALRGMGLLNKENPEWPGTLDAHPLVREHFRDKLQKDRLMWEEGNRILYAYYRDMAPPQPTKEKGMRLLYAAVTHGCAAGLYQQVFDEVLLRRVWRDRRASFSTRHLGMTGSDLVALSNYFQHRQWTQLQQWPLSEPARILILTNAGVRLRQLGRLVDARQCFGAVVREIESIPAQAQESEDASYAAAQYCELLVIAGKLVGSNDDPDTALVNGQRAIEFADRGDEPYFSMHARSSLAEVYFMLGELERANELFEQARAIDQERHPKPPFLYSQSLFRYGYYLIETGRAQELLAGARKSEDWGKNGADTSLLSRAIRSLILGAAHRAVIEIGERTRAFIDEAEKILDEAIVEFRTAGYADYTVRGLLERAHFYRLRHLAEDYWKALENLDLATFEAQRGQMDLLYADILLQRLACYLDFWPMMSNADRADIRNKVTETLKEATDLIKMLHYDRRREMLAALKAVAAQQGVLNEQ